MQQQPPQPQGGSQYAVSPPDMVPFPSQVAGPARVHNLAEAASPISSRLPPPAPAGQNFNELVPAAGAGGFADEDGFAAGEEAERGGASGNRWPREETLALLKIRSEMDAAFKDASLKGPLWEDVSRKLAELGYIRNAKKCKEKFENVHKYYKRTKEGRAGRQDGKSYRFFSQLEALHTGSGGMSTSPTPTTTPTSMANPISTAPAAPQFLSNSIGLSTTRVLQPPPVISAPAPAPAATITPPPAAPVLPGAPASMAAGLSFSSDTFTTSSSEFDDEDTEEGSASREGRKRKRAGGGGNSGGGSRKMMAFFEGLMMQMMEKQEAMQQRFLDSIDKREQERMVREEAWKRQEMARLNREHEMLSQERAMAASRDTAVISFLQKIGGQAIQLPIPAASPPVQQQPPPPQPQQQQTQQTQLPQQALQQAQQKPPPTPPSQPPPPPQKPPPLHQSSEIVHSKPPSLSTELVPVPAPEPHDVAAAGGSFEGVSSSRWPKSEVHALIKLRSGLEGRYQEAGPKGPLWEDISAGMQRLGYNRSSKRCKEKWENINKYFKKVKESNKKRPEDAKTCPYFHQLDALYRKKLFGGTSRQPEQESQQVLMSMAPPLQLPAPETERKTGNENPEGGASNGGLTPSFFEEGASGGSTAMKKPEDIVKELMEQQHRQAAMADYDKMEETGGSDNNMYDEDDDDDEEDRKNVYKIQFQRQNVGGGGGGGGNASAKTATSFLAMVQ